MRAAMLLIAVLLCSGCEKVDYIDIVPPTVVFNQPGNQKNMEAHAMARNGVRAVKAHVVWSVADATIAKVNNKGLLEPLADGSTEVIAKVGDVEARVPVQVVFVDRVEVEPKTLTLTEGGEAVPLKVRAFRKNGKELSDRSPLLSINNKSVAQVVGGTSILPLDPGTATITVQVEGARTSVEVTVEAEKKSSKK